MAQASRLCGWREAPELHTVTTDGEPRTGPGAAPNEAASGPVEGTRAMQDSHSHPNAPAKPRPRLARVEIADFKAIDHLVLDFPPPVMEGDPDVVVIGSANGVGKTSVLEAIGLLFLPIEFPAKWEVGLPPNLARSSIRLGSDRAVIRGDFVENGRTSMTRVVIKENAIGVNREFDPPMPSGDAEDAAPYLARLFGREPDPLLFPPLLLFHGFRMIHPANPSLRALAGNRAAAWETDRIRPSQFKLFVLKLLMQNAHLVEGDEHRAAEASSFLDKLMLEFTDSVFDKFRPSPDDTVEFRLAPSPSARSKMDREELQRADNQWSAAALKRPSTSDAAGVRESPSRSVEKTVSFDNLSSGQKEMISTLFTIWYHSLDHWNLVLIDEPELHLNAGWHMDLLPRLVEMCPGNQYIVATHSEDVAKSVEPNRRIILRPDRSE